MEQFPRRVAQIEERFAVFLNQEALVAADLEARQHQARLCWSRRGTGQQKYAVRIEVASFMRCPCSETTPQLRIAQTSLTSGYAPGGAKFLKDRTEDSQKTPIVRTASWKARSPGTLWVSPCGQSRGRSRLRPPSPSRPANRPSPNNHRVGSKTPAS